MDFFALAQQCAPAVHPQTIAAVVKTESAFDPYAIGINRGTATLKRRPSNKEEAIATANELIAGGHNIDMGLAQINSANLKRLGITVEDVFDPCKNLAASAAILAENYLRAAVTAVGRPQEALKKALSAYNTGNFTAGLRNGYVVRVAQANQQIAQASYTVPALAVSPQAAQAGTAAAQAKDAGPVVLTASRPPHAAMQQAPAAAMAPAAPSDPSLVFGAAPAAADEERHQAMVF